jgi:hypothetical protein
MNAAMLRAIADALLPGDEAGLPRGSTINAVIEALQDNVKPVVALLPEDFAVRDAKKRIEALTQIERDAFQPFREMVLAALKAYYEDKRVLMAMGARPSPPQPYGVTLVPMADDLKPALDKVRARGPLWREA